MNIIDFVIKSLNEISMCPSDDDTLFYYDGPLIFFTTDNSNNLWFLYDHGPANNNDGWIYLCLFLQNRQQMDRLLNESVDIRTFYIENVEKLWWGKFEGKNGIVKVKKVWWQSESSMGDYLNLFPDTLAILNPDDWLPVAGVMMLS